VQGSCLLRLRAHAAVRLLERHRCAAGSARGLRKIR
jgi:hypothetical protein